MDLLRCFLLAYLGTLQLGLSYLLFGWALRRTAAVEASLLVLLEPVLDPIWTFLLARERPGPWAMAGGAVVLLATAWRTAPAPRGARPRQLTASPARRFTAPRLPDFYLPRP